MPQMSLLTLKFHIIILDSYIYTHTPKTPKPTGLSMKSNISHEKTKQSIQNGEPRK